MFDPFKDGIIVSAIPFPPQGFDTAWDKRKWGKRVLREYVLSQHGAKANIREETSKSWDRLTGIKVLVFEEKRTITYMLVEPQDNIKKEVLVNQLIQETDQGSFLDGIDYKLSDTGREARKPLTHNPFAALSNLKKQ